MAEAVEISSTAAVTRTVTATKAIRTSTSTTTEEPTTAATTNSSNIRRISSRTSLDSRLPGDSHHHLPANSTNSQTTNSCTLPLLTFPLFRLPSLFVFTSFCIWFSNRFVFLSPPPLDCEMSMWGEWLPCSAPCNGHGYEERRRNITQAPSLGRAPCGAQVERRYCFNYESCNSNNNNSRSREDTSTITY